MPSRFGVLAGLVLLAAVPSRPTDAVAVLAGGCFWGVESVFEHVRGVRKVTSGYAGGTVASPSYEQVGSGSTGHVEAVEIVYDPAVVSYRQLLEIFFKVAHDPTNEMGQGPDVGPEYRATVFYGNDHERQVVSTYVKELTAAKEFPAPILTLIRPAGPFYPAEAYHQHYAARHQTEPYIVVNDAPKLVRLERMFPSLYRDR